MLEALAELDEAERDALLLPCDVLVQHFPKLELNDYAVTMLKHGQRPQFTEDISAEQPIRVYSRDGTFYRTGGISKRNRPSESLAPDEYRRQITSCKESRS